METISNSEWDVMKVIWTLEPIESRQVVKAMMMKHGWQPSTTKTLLRRLVDKEFLTVTKEGRKNRYTATISEHAATNELVSDTLSEVCPMHRGTALVAAITHNELSAADIERVMAALQHQRIAAPQQVSCNCVPGHCEEESKDGHESASASCC